MERVARPVGQPAEVGVRVLAIGLHDAAELRAIGKRGPEGAQQLEGEVLRLVVLGIEVDRGSGRARPLEDGPQPALGLGEPFGGGRRCEERRQRGRLDRHVDARHEAPGVALEQRRRRPRPGRRDQRLEHRRHTRRVAVRLGFGDDVLAQQVDGRCLAGAPQTLEPRERILGRGTDDQLPRHPPHVASRGRRRDSGAEGHALRQPETEAEGARHLDAVEVLLEVPQDVRVVVAGGKDVDEAEELGLEARMRHGPLEEPLAPPAEVVDARLLGAGGLGDPARDRLDVALEGVEHPRPG